jgi:hypothetical protein
MTNINFLRIVIFKLLFEIDSSLLKEIAEKDAKRLKNNYSEEEYSSIKIAVEWAVENPNYDYKLMLPNMKLSNKSLYLYIKYIQREFEGNENA